MNAATTLKATLLLAVVCLLSSQVSCRHSDDGVSQLEPQREAAQEYMPSEESAKSNLFKYILNAYHRVAAENDRLREEYAQLGSVIKFLTEGKR